MKLEVKNCGECPFANHDNEYGSEMCNLAELLQPLVKEVVVWHWTELPKDRRHEDCPIDTEIVITVK